jgi:tetratricopeptide (TPR) repeat protein
LLLAGEPGIGKSRLLAEAVRRGAAAGWQVLRGGCTRGGGQMPYAPLLQALQGLLMGQPAAERRAALRGCAWLVRLLPELASGPIEPLPSWTVAPEQERRLMFAAVERFLANVAGPAGSLLLLDDLQWAGADALDLLTTLARASAARVRLVCAYRDTEVPSPGPLAVALADLAHAGLVRHQRLPPLTPAEVQHLLDLLLDGYSGDRTALAARVAERTGGVPFFVISCAQALREDAVGDAAPVEVIPWAVAQSIRQRTAALPAQAQEVLGAASIAAGRTVQVAVLGAVLEQSESLILAALEAAWRLRLLEDADGGYRLAHDLIREVLEADLGPARRALLHRRTAKALQGQPGTATAELLAYHYGRSDMPEQAVGYLEQAGDKARAQAAHSAAETFYHEAVTRLDGLGRTVDAARVREKLGTVLHTASQLTQALEVLEQAAAALQLASDAEGMGRVVARIGRVHAHKGTLVEGIARLQAQLETLAMGGPSPSLAALCEALAFLYQVHWQFDAGLAVATRSADVARATGDDGLLAWAEYRRGTLLIMMGRTEEALPALQEASELAEAGGQFDVFGRAAGAIALIAEDRGEFDRGQQYASRMLTSGERLGDRAAINLALLRLAAQAYFTGAWGEGHAYLERIQQLFDRSPSWEAGVRLELGRLAMVEGLWEQATAYLEECSALLPNRGERTMYLVAESLLAEREVLEGHPAAALARLLPVLDREDMQGREVTIHVLPVLAWAYLESDELEQAARTIAEALRRQRAGQYRFGLVDALRVQALITLRQGDIATAERALEEGLALARPMPYPYGEGRLLAVYGQLHLYRGELAPARERLEAADAIFEQLGARKDVERTEHLLAALG